MDDDGWAFRDERGNLYQEAVTGARYLREVYTSADPHYTGRVTVPVLWDRKEQTVVNNESREVLRMLDVDFDHLAQQRVSLYPVARGGRIDETIDAIYEPINNGVYRCGFAAHQSAYDRAFEELCGYLKELYQLPGIADIGRFDHIKHHYYRSHRQLNPKGLIPRGPELAWLQAPHGRERLEGSPLK